MKHGGWIDDDGEVSRMWDIAVPKPFYPEDEASNPVEYEVDSTYDTKLNHTEEVWTCHRCRGSGRVRCTRCRGSGRINRTLVYFLVTSCFTADVLEIQRVDNIEQTVRDVMVLGE